MIERALHLLPRLLATAVALAVPAVWVGEARAATVTLSGSTLLFSAGPGERNRVLVRVVDGAFELSDTGVASLPAPAGCQQIEATRIRCAGGGIAAVELLLGDLDDAAVVDAPLPAVLDGGSGADVLTGGPALDRIYGGPGRDTIRTRDLLNDIVRCGGGVDSFIGDALDVSPRDCESASFLPPGLLSPLLGPGGHVLIPPRWGDFAFGQGPAWVLPPPGRVVAVRPNGIAALRISCPRERAAACAGTVVLETVRAERGLAVAAAGSAQSGHRIVLGKRRFRVARGERRAVRVRLSRRGRRIVRRRRRVRARASVRMDGRTVHRQDLVLRARDR